MERVGVLLIGVGVGALSVGWALMQRQKAAAKRITTPEGNKLPRVLHAVLPEPQTRHRRIIIVGDIHGCPLEFQRLLDKLEFRKGVDVLLSVGDLVNKGPDSPAVLRLARQYGCQAVRGNHDESALAAFSAWLEGRDIPKPHKHYWVERLEAGSADLLQELPFTLELPAYNMLLVHAGLVPGVPLQQQSMDALIKMRDVVPASVASDVGTAGDAAVINRSGGGAFDWEEALQTLTAQAAADRAANTGGSSSNDRDSSGSTEQGTAGDQAGSPAAAAAATAGGVGLLPSEKPVPSGRAWASIWRGPQHVVFGHDAKRRLQLEPHATGLDTGCVYGGDLTACVLPPLDEEGQPVEMRTKVPPGSQEIKLSSGLPAWIVQVSAAEVYCDKAEMKGLREQAQREHAGQQEAQHAAPAVPADKKAV